MEIGFEKDGRIIGIRHRIKKTAEGEARPTQLYMLDGGKPIKYDLATETDELDWAMARYPIKLREVKPEENLTVFLPHQVQWRRLKKEESPDSFPAKLLRQEKKDWLVATKVPVEFDGLRAGDKVAMMLGGSGDILAHALSRRGKDIGAVVYQIPSVALSEHRPGDKENDAQNLAELLRDSPALFYETSFQEREIIRLKQAFAERRDVMKSRVACEQRIFQRVIGQTFIREDGLYPEGEIDDIYKATKANSEVLKKLLKEENERNVELERMVSQLRVYQQLFEPIKGMGPRIASGLIVSIGDIRRFATDAKLKKRCGVHLLPDGRFPRKRRHEPADWQGEARQSLYLLGDQFNRHPETEWGKKLREYKVKLRQKHPQPIKVPKIDPETGEPVIHKKTGKPLMVSKYTDAHIHKMATWRTLTKFTEWLWREWWRLEKT